MLQARFKLIPVLSDGRAAASYASAIVAGAYGEAYVVTKETR